MKQFVQRAGGRIGLWGGLLAAALAAFAAGWLVPARAPVGCNLNELTAAPDFSPFSPAAPAVATSDAGTPAAPSLPEKWVCMTFQDGPSKTTPEVLAAQDAAGVHGTFEGRTVQNQLGYHSYLQKLYGDYMQLPPEDQRVMHGFTGWYLDDTGVSD